MNKLGVCITSYNYGKYLGEAIESCLAQSVPVDIVVVNDASTDDTEDIALSYDVGYLRLMKNSGNGSIPRNEGIKYLRNEYVCSLDADDKLHKDFALHTIEALDKGLGDIISSSYQMFGNENFFVGVMRNPMLVDFLAKNQIHSSSVYRRSMVNEIGEYEPVFGGYNDWEYWLRAVSKGYKFYTVPYMLLFYRKHGKSMVDTAIDKHQEMFEMIKEKHKDIYSRYSKDIWGRDQTTFM